MSCRGILPSLLLLLFLGISLPSCAPEESEHREEADAARKPLVMTTFHPTAYFTERIAGDLVQVECPLPPDTDPAFWTPSRDVIRRYQEADLIVTNGAGFEKWIPTVSLPLSRVVETAASFSDRWLRYAHAVTHSHGPGGKHSHEGIDGHTWIDPIQAGAQAEAILKALEGLLPDAVPRLRRNFAVLEADLAALDLRLRAASEGRTPCLLASHPAYNYLARRYGWRMHNLHLEPSEALTPEALAAVEEALRTCEKETGVPPRHLLWEAEPLPATRDALRERFGLESVVISPAENVAPEERARDEDYLTIMRRNVQRLENILIRLPK